MAEAQFSLCEWLLVNAQNLSKAEQGDLIYYVRISTYVSTYKYLWSTAGSEDLGPENYTKVRLIADVRHKELQIKYCECQNRKFKALFCLGRNKEVYSSQGAVGFQVEQGVLVSTFLNNSF